MEKTSAVADFIAGGGEMGKLMREIDWSKTVLGTVEAWPQSLRTSVSTCLNSKFPILLWWGRDMVMLYNDAYRRILGATKHPAAMGQKGKECWPEIWHIIGPMLEGVLSRGEATWSENQMLPLDRNGYVEECYFTFSYSPIQSEEGTGGIFTAVYETTQQVIAQRRLDLLRILGERSLQARSVKAACEIAGDALRESPHDIPYALIYLYSEDERRFTLCTATGIENASACPEHIAVSKEPDARTWPLARVLETREAYVLENTHALFGVLPGTPWPESSATAVLIPLARSEQQQIDGAVIAGVSPRRKLDEEYLKFLTLVAGQITTTVTNANAYEEERKRAEALAEIDRAKTAFFGNVSHEFRTPLTLMLGPMEDVLNHPIENLTPEQREKIGTSHRNAIRLLKLVNSLLDFSRIEAGRIRASFRPVQISTFTADLASSFRSIIEKAGLKYTIDCAPVRNMVYVDYEMWEKIVLNLLSNAFKYTFDGSITVSLRESADHIIFSVSDTGVGIPEKELPHMFERFHRVDNAGGRSHEGTGIGLSLVKELVNIHKGLISVESRHGKGTTFTVRIPTGKAHLSPEKVLDDENRLYSSVIAESFIQEADILASHDHYYVSDLNDANNTSQAQNKPRVMIVDDNADMIIYLKRLLERSYEVETARNGQEALRRIMRRKPDLVVSDVMMPVMDGVQLVEKLKADHEMAEVPVMLLSARAGEEARIEGYGSGADDYLVKPFSAKELMARVGAQLRIAKTRAHISAQLRNVFEQTPAAIAIISRNNYALEFANDLYLEIIDKGPESVGKSLFDLLPELTGQGIKALLDNVMESGEPHSGTEFEVDLNRNGKTERTYFNFIYHPLRQEDDRISGVIVVCFNVTDLVTSKKRAEEGESLLEQKVRSRTAELEASHEAMRQQRDFVEKIVNSSIDNICVLDKELRYIGFNEKCESTYQKRREEVLGRNVLDVFPKLSGSMFHHSLQKALTGIAVSEQDYQSLITGRHFEINFIPLKDQSQQVYAVLVIAHDNTQAIEAAKSLEEKNDQLSRTNRELERFAYIASHDLQEPLRKIRTFSSMIQRALPEGFSAMKYFEKIHTSCERMSSLIKDLLDYSRLSGAQVDQAMVDLNTVVKNVIADYELLIEETGVKIECGSLPVVSGIPLQLHQLFSNLIGNSLKFAGPDPQIGISSGVKSANAIRKYFPTASANDYIEVIVRDNGIGFDQKFAEQIFTIFQRLNDRRVSGTGIGLAICRKIVESHNGFIRAEGKPGEGAAFYVYFPGG